MADDPPEYQHPEHDPGEALTLWEAMSRLQCQLPRIAKRADAQYGKYADLASISHEMLPLLGMLGLSFTCAPGFDSEGRFALNYQLEHISGEGRIAGSYPLPTGTPQQIGSAITYARRYVLCAVTGLAPDDDDDDAQAAEDAARAMRRKDPEVDEYGAATLAEQTRMITGREPGVHRSKDMVVDDRWTSDAPSWLVGVDPPEDQPGSILPAQRSQIMAVYAALGIKIREARLADAEKVLGIGPGLLGSVNDLSHQQAARLLENLHERHTGKMTRR